MRKSLALICMIATTLAGCTTLQTAEMSSSELHTQIRSGELLSVGDRIVAVTSDGSEHKFKVTDLDDTSIHGQDESILIDDIVALQTRTISAGKTALLAGGIGYGVFTLIGVLFVIGAGMTGGL